MEDLFDMDVDSGMSFLNEESETLDGLYKPSLKKAKDPKKGYRAVLRLLPNFSKEGVLGPNSIKRITQYVDLPEHPDLKGYYDSPKTFGKKEKCLLTDTYWRLEKSSSVVEKERAGCINKSEKYYCYVQIIEDENQPELVGKILVYPAPKTIYKKFQEEYSGALTGKKVNVFDLANGKDLILFIKEKGGHTNYDSAQFKSDPSPMQMFKNGGFKPFPVEEGDNGRKKIVTKYQSMVKEALFNREAELEDFEAKRLSEEDVIKIKKIIGILTNTQSPMGGDDSDDLGLDAGEELFGDDDLPTDTGSDDEDDFFDM